MENHESSCQFPGNPRVVIEESKILRGLGNGIVEIQDLAWTWRGCRGFEHWVTSESQRV